MHSLTHLPFLSAREGRLRHAHVAMGGVCNEQPADTIRTRMATAPLPPVHARTWMPLMRAEIAGNAQGGGGSASRNNTGGSFIAIRPNKLPPP